MAAAFFAGAGAAAFGAAFFAALGAATLAGLAVTAAAAIFFAVAALRFARVLLLLATVLPVPLLPLRRFARLVVMFLRMGRKLCKVFQCPLGHWKMSVERKVLSCSGASRNDTDPLLGSKCKNRPSGDLRYVRGRYFVKYKQAYGPPHS